MNSTFILELLLLFFFIQKEASKFGNIWNIFETVSKINKGQYMNSNTQKF